MSFSATKFCEEAIKYKSGLCKDCEYYRTMNLTTEVEVCILSDKFLISCLRPDYTCKNFKRKGGKTMTKEQEEIIKRLKNMRESTRIANECGLSTNDFKEDLETYDLVLNLMQDQQAELKKKDNYINYLENELKGKEGICNCGKNGIYQYNPYDEEINNKQNLECLCKTCYQQNCDDI